MSLAERIAARALGGPSPRLASVLAARPTEAGPGFIPAEAAPQPPAEVAQGEHRATSPEKGPEATPKPLCDPGPTQGALTGHTGAKGELVDLRGRPFVGVPLGGWPPEGTLERKGWPAQVVRLARAVGRTRAGREAAAWPQLGPVTPLVRAVCGLRAGPEFCGVDVAEVLADEARRWGVSW